MSGAREGRTSDIPHCPHASARYYFANFLMTSSVLFSVVARYHDSSTSLVGSERIASPRILPKKENTRTKRKSRLRSIPLASPIQRTLHESPVCSVLLCQGVCLFRPHLNASRVHALPSPQKNGWVLCSTRETSGGLVEVRREARSGKAEAQPSCAPQTAHQWHGRSTASCVPNE